MGESYFSIFFLKNGTYQRNCSLYALSKVEVGYQAIDCGSPASDNFGIDLSKP
jgi:hypothetical protein